jgi:hypothetical protein
VTGDPPTGRGQLAAPLQTEVTYPLKIQLRNRPPKRVIPISSPLQNPGRGWRMSGRGPVGPWSAGGRVLKIPHQARWRKVKRRSRSGSCVER